MWLAFPRTPSQCPTPPLSSSFRVTIFNAFKLTKSKKRSRIHLATVGFGTIEIRDVKYLRPLFDGNKYLCCPLLYKEFQMLIAHPWMARTNCAMDALGAQPKQQISKKEIRFSFACFPYASHLQCTKMYCDCMDCSGGVCKCSKWIGLTPIQFFVEDVILEKSRLKCKVCHSILVYIA